MFKFKLTQITTIALAASLSLGSAALAQTVTPLDPYAPGVYPIPADLPPLTPNLPPIGNGLPPLPEIPGSPGPAPGMTYIYNQPANTLGNHFVGVPVPLSIPNSADVPPGFFQTIGGFIPITPPATNVTQTPYLTAPAGWVNPAQIDLVPPAGGKLPGTGGYDTSISKIRRSGQTTRQFDQRAFASTFNGGDNQIAQDEVAETGTVAGFGLPYGIPTGNGYNNGPKGSNNDLRQSDIDLGGQTRVRVGNVTLNTKDQTLQQYGSNVFRSDILPLHANRSYEFGERFIGLGVTPNDTTDFGTSYKQFLPANVGIDATGQLLDPRAIETNK